MGDEIGMLNDPSFRETSAIAHDARWIHRPAMDWATAQAAAAADTPAGWLFRGTRHLMAVRKATPQLASDVPTEIIRHGNPHLFAVRRPADDATLTCAYNFTAAWQSLPAAALGLDPAAPHDELITGRRQDFPHGDLALPPLGRLWLRPTT